MADVLAVDASWAQRTATELAARPGQWVAVGEQSGISNRIALMLDELRQVPHVWVDLRFLPGEHDVLCACWSRKQPRTMGVGHPS